MRVLLRDPSFVVLYKPRGPEYAEFLRGASSFLGVPLFGVHRLDAVTSGATVAALSRRAASSLSLGWPGARKSYLALCLGVPPRPRGAVEAALGRREDARGYSRTVVTKTGEAARTEYEVVAARGESSCVRAELETGRRHQIRAHMAHVGCPLGGDRKYGERVRGLGGAREMFGEGDVHLHAQVLEFDHPDTGERVRVEAPLPEHFVRKAKQLGLDIGNVGSVAMSGERSDC